MMTVMKKMLAISGLCLISISWADASYVQALPTPDDTPIVSQSNDANTGQLAVTPSTKKSSSKYAQTNNASNSPMDQSAQTTLLLSRVMQVNQDFLNYQSKTTDQLNQLQTDHQQIAQQMTTLASQMALLSTKVTALAQVTLAKQVPTSMIQQWEENLGVIPFYAILGLFILLIVVIIILVLPKKPRETSKDKEADKSDYDYLSTKEAIPAKLDLARSYIVMEDFEAAEAVLEEVIQQGDAEQVEMAKTLQQQCQKDASST